MSANIDSKSSSEYTKSGFLAVSSANVGWGIADVCISIIGRGQVVTWAHGITGAVFLALVMLGLRFRTIISNRSAANHRLVCGLCSVSRR